MRRADGGGKLGIEPGTHVAIPELQKWLDARSSTRHTGTGTAAVRLTESEARRPGLPHEPVCRSNTPSTRLPVIHPDARGLLVRAKRPDGAWSPAEQPLLLLLARDR